MKLDREQCIELAGAVSKTNIDVFELRTGSSEFLFRRNETLDSSGDGSLHESIYSDVEVLSPVLGILRTSSGDGAPPYVQPGQLVSEDDIICVIDVLDRRHQVAAGVHGVLAALCVGNGELVEYKQRLAVIQSID